MSPQVKTNKSFPRLCEFMTKRRHGESYKDNEDEHDLMLRLAEKYSDFEESSGMTSMNGNADGATVPEVVVGKNQCTNSNSR